MAHNCRKCGAEIFTGQRFCRSCGRPTGGFLEEDSPTQVMQPGPPPEAPGPGSGYVQGPGGQADTAPQRPVTSPVNQPQTGYPPQQAYYQQGYSPQTPAAPYQYPQPQKGVRWGWIIALIGVGLFGAMFLAILMFARSVRHARDQAGFPFQPPPPPVIAMQPGENVLSDDGAVINGGETVITKTFPMTPGGNLTIVNVNGDITVEGWDEDQAEVKVTKRGGSEMDRRNVQVVYKLASAVEDHSGRLSHPEVNASVLTETVLRDVLPKVSSTRGGLSLRTVADRPNMSNIQVRYEIKLPRELKQVDIKGVNGSIKLSDLNGSISARTTNGSVDLADLSVNGQLQVETVNGSVRAAIDEMQQKGAVNFATTNGGIEVELRPDVNAQLSASSMHGSIGLDDAFGLKVEKGFPFGQHVDGPLGRGGPPITFKTVNGSIKITK
jgi:DUF4097 and DUF4098 domain-containing protein YvlB